MKIANLVYLVVKNAKYLEDTGFTYSAFINKEYDGDTDYTNSINNAITPINEAIHRLSDRNKIAFKVIKSTAVNGDGFIHLEDMNIAPKIKKIKSIFFFTGSDYITIPYREVSRLKIFVGIAYQNVDLFIQYIEDIPPFELAEIYEEATNVELKDLGISDTMCDYIIEYAQGRLQEIIDPQLANLHLTRAEQYFADLEEQQTYFSKNHVKRKFSIR